MHPKGVPGGSSGAPRSTSPKHGRARDMSSGCHVTVVVDDNDVERQPCHCGRGSGHEQPGECSGDNAIRWWVAAGGAPLLAGPRALGPDWISATPRTGSGTVLFGSGAGLLPRWSGASPLDYPLGACPALVSRLCHRRMGMRASRVACAAVRAHAGKRQLTKVGRGLRERSRVPKLASQWDGRITS